MFAFSQVEPRDQGQVTPNIPLSRYLGAAWDQGVHDAMGGSLYRISEQWQMENNVSLWGALDQQAGRMLDPNEANDRYGTRRLRFTEPVYEGVAELLKNRHDENETRNFILSSGGAGVGRFAASFGVGMLASLSNPVDFTTMFVPIVGSEALATKLATMGLSPVRQGLARGLITEERLRAIVPAPRVVAAIIEGTVGQAIAEVPLYISNRMDQTPYTVMDSLQNIALGGAFAGTLRLALSGAGRLVGRLMPDTKKALAQKGLADFLLGDDIKVHELVNLDENVIREKVEFDIVAAKKAAREAVAGADSELKSWAEAQLDVQGHLGGVDQPNLFKVAEDWIPIWKEQGKGVEIVSKLFERAKQDPSIENLTNLASQFNLKFDPMERKLPSQYYLAKPKDVARMQRVAGVSDADLKVTGQLSNAQRRQQAAVMSMQRKDQIDKLVREEKDRRIKAYVEDLRKKFDPEQETRKKINQEVMEQQKLGKVLSTEQVEKYKQSANITEQDVAVLEKDVENLKKSLDIKDDDADLREFADALEKKMEKGGTTGAIEHIVKSLEGLKIKTGGDDVRYSGIPPEAWNALIDLVIEGVQAGERLYKSVEQALDLMLPAKNAKEEKAAVEAIFRWVQDDSISEPGKQLGKSLKVLEKYATNIPVVFRVDSRKKPVFGHAGWSEHPDMVSNDFTEKTLLKNLKDLDSPEKIQKAAEDRFKYVTEQRARSANSGYPEPDINKLVAEFELIRDRTKESLRIFREDRKLFVAENVRGISHKTKLRLLSKHGLIDKIDANMQTETEAFLIDVPNAKRITADEADKLYEKSMAEYAKKYGSNEDFGEFSKLLDEAVGNKEFKISLEQAEAARAALYDRVAEFRPAAMMTVDELRKDLGPMVKAAGRDTRRVYTGMWHGELVPDRGATEQDFNVMADTLGFITKTRRMVSREEASALSGEWESQFMQILKEAVEYREIHGAKKIAQEVADGKRAMVTLDLLDKFDNSKDGFEFWHAAEINAALDNNQPVSKQAVKDYLLPVPGHYVEAGDLLVPAGKELSAVFEDQLLLDNLRNCIIK